MKSTNYSNGIYTDPNVFRNWNTSVIKMMEFDAMIEDLENEGMSVNDLMDIWENSAYIAFVALIGGYINYDEDGY